MPVRKVPLLRLREVVLHHVDLDAGYTLADAPGGVRPRASWPTRRAGSPTSRRSILDAGDGRALALRPGAPPTARTTRPP